MDTDEKNYEGANRPDPDRMFDAIGGTLYKVVTEGRKVVAGDKVENVDASAADIGAALKWVAEAKKAGANVDKKWHKLVERAQETGGPLPALDTEGDDAASS